MSREDLMRIVQLCLSLDEKACLVYHEFSVKTRKAGLKAFWKSMSEEEKLHMFYWKNLLKMLDNMEFIQVFDHPEDIVTQLEDLLSKADALIKSYRNKPDDKAAFLAALRLEFMLLHPAFETLFFFMKIISKDDLSPVKDYEAHLNKFVSAAREFGTSDPEFDLIGDLLNRLWKENRELAEKIYDLKILRNIIIICSHCQKIRDNDGNWYHMDEYIRMHSDADFSHSICPDCSTRLLKIHRKSH